MKSRTKNFFLYLFSCFLIITFTAMDAEAKRQSRYGERLCNNAGYSCYVVKRGDTWHKLWPEYEQRNIIQHVNRMNTRLYVGLRVAIPDNLENITKMDVAPFPFHIKSSSKKKVIFDHSKNAWGAYNKAGQLVNWAPASGGKEYCPDVRRRCRTVTGNFAFYHKRGENCKSSKYPVGKGGAPMPYCMFFYKGYALHGSHTVPGHHASHGCVRTFPNEARWLSESFLTFPGRGGRTEMIIR